MRLGRIPRHRLVRAETEKVELLGKEKAFALIQEHWLGEMLRCPTLSAEKNMLRSECAVQAQPDLRPWGVAIFHRCLFFLCKLRDPFLSGIGCKRFRSFQGAPSPRMYAWNKMFCQSFFHFHLLPPGALSAALTICSRRGQLKIV